MKTVLASIQDIIDQKVKCPLDISLIPNTMGINLSSVEAVSWTRQPDGQLVSVTVHFIPAVENPRYKEGIDFLSITFKTEQILKAHAINTIGQLVSLTEEDVLKLQTSSQKTLRDIKHALAEINLSLKRTPNDDNNPWLRKTISDLNLTTRSTNGLRAEGITAVAELVKITRHELSRIPNLGRQSQQEIIDILASKNLSLRP